MGYNEDMAIDPHHLDEEMLRQPQIYVKYAKLAVKAEKEAKKAEREYDLVKADYERRIRRNPHHYDLTDKPTESAVKGKAETMPKVKRMYKRYIRAWSKSKTMQKIEKGFSQRKGMLEALSRYDVKMYYASPNVSGDRQTRLRSKSIKKKMNQRKLKRRR
jgi:hypothetical protein